MSDAEHILCFKEFLKYLFVHPLSTFISLPVKNFFSLLIFEWNDDLLRN